jgi:hypothetical protein
MSDEPNQVEDEQPRKRFSPVAVSLVFSVLYPLSIGPAAGLIVWLGESTPAGQRLDDILTVVYRPMVWIAEKSPLLMGWLTTYMSWFMR